MIRMPRKRKQAKYRQAKVVSLVVLLVIVAGCGGSHPAGINNDTEAVQPIVSNKVKVLDKYDVQIVEKRENRLILDGDLPSLERDDVLVSGQGEGLLRKVVSIQRGRATTIVVETAPATLEDVFEQADIYISKIVTPDDIILPQGLPDGVTIITPSHSGRGEVVALEFKTQESIIFGSGKSSISASMSMKFGLKYDLIIKIRQRRLVYFLFALSPTLKGDMKLRSAVSFLNKKVEKTIFLIIFKPFVVWVSGVPIVVVPELKIYLGLDGTAVAGLEMAMVDEATLRIGLEFSNGFWHPIADKTFEAHLLPDLMIKPFGELSAKAYMRLELAFKLYGATGPFSKIEEYIEGKWTYQSSPTPTHTIDFALGLASGVGVKVDIPVIGNNLIRFEKENLVDIKKRPPFFPIILSGSAEVPVIIQ